MAIISKIYHFIIPQKLRKRIGYRRKISLWQEKYALYELSRVVEKYYKSKHVSPEVRTALIFLRNHHFNLDTFKLLYVSNVVDVYFNKYKNMAVYQNDILNLPYVLHNNKPLYFPREYNEITIRKCYAQFLYEMDKDSPHLYCLNPKELKGRILFDCGVAEGLFPLNYIDSFKEIVLFECDTKWIEPLKATFEPYKKKVSIVNAYVSNDVSNDNITLDYYAATHNIRPSFIKMDIEGFEESALRGAKHILNESNDLICAICTYHTPYAERNIVHYMKEYGFSPKYNKGYMFFHYEKPITPPYLRRGVVRFIKEQQ